MARAARLSVSVTDGSSSRTIDVERLADRRGSTLEEMSCRCRWPTTSFLCYHLAKAGNILDTLTKIINLK
eukprot:2609901-Rhodomonas_salina.1